MRIMAAVVHFDEACTFDSVIKNMAHPLIERQIEFGLDNERRGADLFQAASRIREKLPVRGGLAAVKFGVAGVHPLEHRFRPSSRGTK